MVTIRAAAAAGGIEEGNFTNWTLQWVNYVPDGVNDDLEIDMTMNPGEDVFYLVWNHYIAGVNKHRFSVRKLSDFSSVYTSPQASDYSAQYPYTAGMQGIRRGSVGFSQYGFSASFHKYFLLLRNDYKTFEIWRGNSATRLWFRDVSGDFTNYEYDPHGLIDLLGEWMLIWDYDSRKVEIACYKGT